MDRTLRFSRIIPALLALPLTFTATARADEAPAAEPTATDAAPAADAVATESKDEEGIKLAQASGEPAPAQSSSSTPDGTVSEQAPAPAAPGEKKDEKVESSQPVNPALAAGGIVGGGSAFPLHLNISITQSVGSGTFAPGYAFTPSFPTNVSLRPFYSVHQFFDWQPRMILNGRLDLDMEWASNSVGAFGASTADRMLRVSDAQVGLVFPGLLSTGYGTEFITTAISPVLRTILPLSVASRFQNRLLGFGAAAQMMTNVNAGPGGIFTFIYSPSASGWSFTGDAPTVRCGESLNAGGGLFGAANPVDAQTDAPLAIARPEEYTDEAGVCRVRGRQIVGSLVNSFAGAWTLSDPWNGSHSFSSSFGTWHQLLRPLEDRPDLRSEYAQAQDFIGFSELTFGDVSYSYSLPIETSVTITAGVSSFQPMFDNHGVPRFPWFDLVMLNPSTFGRTSNNFTSGYLNLTIAL